MRVAMDVLNGFLSNKFVKEGWRLPSWDNDDYVQEGLLQYLHIEHHYNTIEEPKHLMALFKTHWMRHIHDKTKKEPPFACQSSLFSGDADEDFELVNLEAAAALDGIEEREAIEYLTGDAADLLRLFTTPNEAVTAGIQGIVLTTKQAKAVAGRLGITVARVRGALTTIVKEFITMPTPIQLLATATGLNQQTHEKREPYLKRLLDGVSDLTEEQWEALNDEAKAAYNQMADAFNAGKPLVESTPGAEETPKAIKTTRAGNGGNPTAQRAVRDKAVQSPTSRARELMVMAPDTTATDIIAKLVAEGISPPSLASVQAMRSEIKAVLRILSANHLLVSASARNAPKDEVVGSEAT